MGLAHKEVYVFVFLTHSTLTLFSNGFERHITIKSVGNVSTLLIWRWSNCMNGRILLLNDFIRILQSLGNLVHLICFYNFSSRLSKGSWAKSLIRIWLDVKNVHKQIMLSPSASKAAYIDIMKESWAWKFLLSMI